MMEITPAEELRLSTSACIKKLSWCHMSMESAVLVTKVNIDNKEIIELKQ